MQCAIATRSASAAQQRERGEQRSIAATSDTSALYRLARSRSGLASPTAACPRPGGVRAAAGRSSRASRLRRCAAALPPASLSRRRCVALAAARRRARARACPQPRRRRLQRRARAHLSRSLRRRLRAIAAAQPCRSPQQRWRLPPQRRRTCCRGPCARPQTQPPPPQRSHAPFGPTPQRTQPRTAQQARALIARPARAAAPSDASRPARCVSLALCHISLQALVCVLCLPPWRACSPRSPQMRAAATR